MKRNGRLLMVVAFAWLTCLVQDQYPPSLPFCCMNPILVMSVSRRILGVGLGRDDNLIELVRASSHDRISERQQAKLSFYLFYSLFFLIHS